MNLSRYDAVICLPCAALGIVIGNDALSGIDFLPASTQPVPPRGVAARRVCAALQAYLDDPAYRFTLPLELKGTAFQRKVWQALGRIPAGTTLSYGELARRLGSSPRAVGQACGANPVPVVVPCHRVLAKSGPGGFMHSRDGDPLRIKHWLLEHEARAKQPA